MEYGAVLVNFPKLLSSESQNLDKLLLRTYQTINNVKFHTRFMLLQMELVPVAIIGAHECTATELINFLCTTTSFLYDRIDRKSENLTVPCILALIISGTSARQCAETIQELCSLHIKYINMN